MKKNETDSLNQRIILLENQQALEMKALREQFKLAYESLRPINLIKSTFHDVTASPNLKGNIVDSAIGLAVGFLSRKVLVGSSHNPLKNIVGTMLQFAISNFASKHTDNIKTAGMNIFGRIFKGKRKTEGSNL